MEIKTELQETLNKYGQNHILMKYNTFNEQEKDKFLSEINEIDFEQMENLFNNINKKEEIVDEIKPIDYIEKNYWYDFCRRTAEQCNRCNKQYCGYFCSGSSSSDSCICVYPGVHCR